MILAQPWMLLLLTPMLVVALTAWRSRAREERLPAAIRTGLAVGGRIRFGRKPRVAVRWRFWLAMVFAVLALARPQFGTAPRPSYVPGGEVMIALDLSRSMLATDTAPSRLERARAVATRLAAALPAQKVGLIGFAGSAFLLAPISRDRAMLDAYLPALSPDDMPDPGTDIAALLQTASDAFGRASLGCVLLVLSDGEADPTIPWKAQLAAMNVRHIRIVTVGFGTAEGAPVPGPGGATLRDRAGTPVQSRVDAGVLRQLGTATGGAYLPAAATDDDAVAARVRSILAHDAGEATNPSTADNGRDLFPWLLLASFLLLAWSVATEWEAVPRLARLGIAAGPVLGGVALLVATASGQRPAMAQSAATTPSDGRIKPEAIPSGQPGIVTAMLDPDLHDIEADPLLLMKQAVARLIVKKEITAADWLYLANTAARYGEVHRGHAHPLSGGVMRDGLLAVERGRRLDPRLADWDALAAKLHRLLIPPAPPHTKGSNKRDDANEPTMANRQKIIPSEPPPHQAGQRDQSADQWTRKDDHGDGDGPGMRNVAGNRADHYDPAEWRNPELVRPLYLLDKLRAADSPAQLFRMMHPPSAGGATRRAQTW